MALSYHRMPFRRAKWQSIEGMADDYGQGFLFRGKFTLLQEHYARFSLHTLPVQGNRTYVCRQKIKLKNFSFLCFNKMAQC